MSQSTISKLREGTEVLRTGGGTTLTARDCRVLCDLVELSEDMENLEQLDAKRLSVILDSLHSMSEVRVLPETL